MNDYDKEISRFVFERDDENGMLIGPDGTHHNTEAEAMYYGQLGLCGCGNPNDVHEFIVKCLQVRNEKHKSLLDMDGIEELVVQNPRIVAQFLGHFFGMKYLTEHGGSVYGSWLTERGKQFLEIGPMKDSDDYGSSDFGDKQ